MQSDYIHPKTDSFLTECTRHLIHARYRIADSRIQRYLAYLANPTASEFIGTCTRYALERLAAYPIPALEDLCPPMGLTSFLCTPEEERRYLLDRDLTFFLQTLEKERRYLLDMLMPAITGTLPCICPSASPADFERRFELLVDSDFDGWQSEAHLKVAEQLRHSQVQIAGILELGISRLTPDTAIEAVRSDCLPPAEHPNKTFLKQKQRDYQQRYGARLTYNAISAEVGYECVYCTQLKRWMKGARGCGKADVKIRAALERLIPDTPPAIEAEKVRRERPIFKKT